MAVAGVDARIETVGVALAGVICYLGFLGNFDSVWYFLKQEELPLTQSHTLHFEQENVVVFFIPSKEQ